jgi:competence protein ComEA
MAATDSPVPPPAPDSVARNSLHLPSYLLGLVTALVLAGSAFFLLWRPEPAAVELQQPPTPVIPTSSALSAQPTPSAMVVYVSGAVRQPGLYTLPPIARIGDAITAAGGLLEDADPAAVNQAQPLVDGAQLHIPAMAPPALLGSLSGEPSPVQQAAPATPAAGLTEALSALTMNVRSAPAAQSAAEPQHANAASPSSLIDVNTATAAELESLPGIGPAKAQAIIDHRPYGSVDELDRVPGIGPSTLERLLPLVTAL